MKSRYYQWLSALLIFLSLALPLEGKACDLESGNCLPPSLGIGTKKCKEWTENRNGEQSQIYAEWLLGFYSGYNYYHSTKYKGLFFPYDEAHLLEWVDNNCEIHPDKTVTEIADHFINSIATKKK